MDWIHRMLSLVGFRSEIDKAVDNIFHGDFLAPDILNNTLFDFVTNDSLRDSLTSASSNLERIALMEKYFDGDLLIKCIEYYEPYMIKDNKIAIKLRDKGRALEDKGDVQNARRCQKLAECFVLCGSVFNQDVQGHQEDNNGGNQTEINEMTTAMHKHLNEVMFRPFGEPNEIMPAASHCVDLLNTNSKGRLLRVNANVEPGTTLICEDPLAAVLTNTFSWEMEHCAKCYKKIDQIFPCKRCVFSVYCSPKCRSEDFDQGHKNECACFGALHVLRANPCMHLCLKTICKVGPKAIFDLFMRSKFCNVAEDPDLISGINPKTGVYESGSYYQILRLKSHIVTHEIVKQAWLAKALTALLERRTNFFSDAGFHSWDLDRDAIVNFVASLILQHLTTFKYNTFGLNMRPDVVKAHEKKLARNLPAGAITYLTIGLYSLTSMINHSCDPNVFWENLPNGKLAIISYRKLRAGEEIVHSYGVYSSLHNLATRRETMLNRYHFTCTCTPCRFNWPLISKFDPKTTWLCTNCQADEQVNESKSQLMIYPESHLNCTNCGEEVSQDLVTHTIRQCYDVHKSAKKFLEDGEPLEALPLIVSCIQMDQDICKPPYLRVIQSQEVLRQTCRSIVHISHGIRL